MMDLFRCSIYILLVSHDIQTGNKKYASSRWTEPKNMHPAVGQTQTSLLGTELWEIAKIFMGQSHEAFKSGGDTIALLQLVTNCWLFATPIVNRKSFVEVKEIRKFLIQFAHLKLNDTNERPASTKYFTM